MSKRTCAYRLHDQRRGHIHRDALERVHDHQPRADFVDRQRLERVLERADPLQPPQNWRDVVQVHEEARIRHLVQRRQRGQEDRDAAVAEQACEEEVLGQNTSAMRYLCDRADEFTKRVMASVYSTRMNRNLKKCAASWARPAIQYVLRAGQCLLLPRSAYDVGVHGGHDDCGDDPERDYIEYEAREQPSSWTAATRSDMTVVGVRQG